MAALLWAQPGSALLGDLNLDDQLDPADALILHKILSDELVLAPGTPLFSAADVAPLVGGVPHPDGKINVADLLVLTRALVEADLLPMPPPTIALAGGSGPLVAVTGQTLPGATVELLAPNSLYYDTAAPVATVTAGLDGAFQFHDLVLSVEGDNTFVARAGLEPGDCASPGLACGESNPLEVPVVADPNPGDLTVASGTTQVLVVPTGGAYTLGSVVVETDAQLVVVGNSTLDVESITVEADGRLLVDGNAHIRMLSPTSQIDVYGTFEVRGRGQSLAERVWFSSDEATLDRTDVPTSTPLHEWSGIVMHPGAVLDVQRALISNASNGILALSDPAVVRVDDTWFRDDVSQCFATGAACFEWKRCSGYAVSAVGGYVEITGNRVYTTFLDTGGERIHPEGISAKAPVAGSLVSGNEVVSGHRAYIFQDTIGSKISGNLAADSQVGMMSFGNVVVGSNEFHGAEIGIRLRNGGPVADSTPQTLIDGDATLTTSSITIGNNSELEVQPGATLQFYPVSDLSTPTPVSGEKSGIVVGWEHEETCSSSPNFSGTGRLSAPGTSTSPIRLEASPTHPPAAAYAGGDPPVLTSAPTAPAPDGSDRWTGVHVSQYDAEEPTQLSHLEIVNANSPLEVQGVASPGGVPQVEISESTIDDFTSQAIRFETASGRIENNTILLSAGSAGQDRDGIVLDHSNADIIGNTLDFEARDAILVKANDESDDGQLSPLVRGNIIDTRWDYAGPQAATSGVGLSVDGARVGLVEKNLFRDSRIGVELRDSRTTDDGLPYIVSLLHNVFLDHDLDNPGGTSLERWAVYSENVDSDAAGTRNIFASGNYWGSDDLAVIRSSMIRDAASGGSFYQGGSGFVLARRRIIFAPYCTAAELSGDPENPSDPLRVGDGAACAAGGAKPLVVEIRSDLTLRALPGGDPYTVLTGFHVEAGATLTLEPGVVLEFAAGTELFVEGTLVAVGGESPAERIVLRGADGPVNGSWDGVRIKGTVSSLTSQLRNVDIENAHVGVRAEDVDVVLAGNVVRSFGRAVDVGSGELEGTGIWLQNVTGVARNNRVEGRGPGPDENDVYGMRVVHASPLLLENEVEGVTVGVYIAGSASPRLVRNRVTDARAIGVRIRPSADPTIGPGNRILDSGTYGVEVNLDGSSGFGQPMHFNTITGSGTADLRLAATNPFTADVRWNVWTGNADPFTRIVADPGITVLAHKYIDASTGNLEPSGSGDWPDPARTTDADYLFGDVSGTLAGSYFALGDLRVPAGQMLTFPAGSGVDFPAYAKLLVDAGDLVVSGTGNPATFRGYQGQVWHGIELQSSTATQIDGADIADAFRAVAAYGSSLDVTSSTIALVPSYSGSGGATPVPHEPAAGIYLVGSGPLSSGIVGNTLTGTQSESYAIYLEDSTPLKDELELRGNQIVDAGTGIYITGDSKPLIGVADIATGDPADANVISGSAGYAIEIVGGGVGGPTPAPTVRGNDLGTGNTGGVRIATYHDPGAGAQTVDLGQNYWGVTTAPEVTARISYEPDPTLEPGGVPAVRVDASDFLDAPLASMGTGTGITAQLAVNALYGVSAGVHPVVSPASSLQVDFSLAQDASKVVLSIWRDGLEDDLGDVGVPVTIPGTPGSEIATRELTGLTAAGSPHTIVWDGILGDGTGSTFAPSDLYAFTLRALDGGGAEIGSYAPQRTEPVGTRLLSFSEDFDVFDNQPFRATLAPPDADRIAAVIPELRLGAGTPTVLEIGGRRHIVIPAGSPGVEVLWDGRLPGSEAILTGPLSIVFKLFLIRTLPSTFILEDVEPDLVDANDGGPVIRANPKAIVPSYDQISTLTFRVDQDSNVKIDLIPLAGGGSIEIFDQTGVQKDTPIVVEWRSRLDTDPGRVVATASGGGYYTYRIEATSTETERTTVVRGMLRVDELGGGTP